MNDHTQIILIVTIFCSADYIYSRHLVRTSISGETYHSSFQYIFFLSCISLSLKTASFPPKHTHNRAVVLRTLSIVQGVTCLEFASRIGFDRKVICLTYFYLTRFPTAKASFKLDLKIVRDILTALIIYSSKTIFYVTSLIIYALKTLPI